MMLYAPLADTRLGAAVFVLPAYAAQPTRRERVSRRGPSGAGERAARALTQERAQRTLRCLPAGRTAAARSAAHSPAVKDPSNNTPLRPGRGLGAPSHQRVRQPTPARPGTSVPC